MQQHAIRHVSQQWRRHQHITLGEFLVVLVHESLRRMKGAEIFRGPRVLANHEGAGLEIETPQGKPHPLLPL